MPTQQLRKPVDPKKIAATFNTAPAEDPGDYVAPGPVVDAAPVAQAPQTATIELTPEKLAEMINAAVNAKVAEIRGPEYVDPAVIEPEPVYKKTYRCDASPNLRMMKMDVLRAQAEGKRPQEYPISGFIEFKNGFYKTNDDNEIAQMEWSMSNPSVRGSLFDGDIVGGNPSIYEDDGAYIYRCDVSGCEFVTASERAMRAHKASSHRFI